MKASPEQKRESKGIVRSALLFSSLVVLVLKLIVPTLVDGPGAAFVLIFFPSLLLFSLAHLLIRRLTVGRRRETGLVMGGLLALLCFALTDYDLRLLFLVVPGLLSSLFFFRRTLSWVLIAGTFVVSAFPIPGSMTRGEAPRLLVVGFDAMTPSIVDSLVRRGDLPNMKRLIEGGTWGDLRSEEPMISPVLWTIIASGCNREETGVGSFYNLSTQVRVPRLWDMFEERGWKVGVFRWLLTWPPRPVDGFMVPDLLARDNSSYPPGYGEINDIRDIVKSGKRNVLVEMTALGWNLCRDGVRGSTLVKLLWHALRLNVSLGDEKIFYRYARMAELEVSADIFLNLVHTLRPAFATFYDNGIDMMSHRMWKYHDPEGFDVSPEEKEKYGSHVCDMYRYSDAVLGRILSDVRDDVNVVVVSDHGTEKSESKDDYFFAVNADNLFRDLGLEERLFTHSLNNNQFVYPVSEEDRSRFPLFLEERLSRLVFENGIRLFTLSQSEAGDYYLVNNHLAGGGTRLTLDGTPVDVSRYVERAFNLSGTHSLYGTVIFHGGNVKRGEVIEGATIHDIAPTVLHWAGLSVGQDMDGKVLVDIFEEGREIAYIPHYEYPKVVDSSGAVLDRTTKERLKAMGYVQ